ncbi:MAG: helix-turn-helix transcriptional regulator [Clostridia bacterium]|nr:helix-turn-helix transcriptional regulator [Clostridia bacterium]
MDVLSRIKELQSTRHISTYELAKRSGVAVNTIYNWERLNYSPTLDTLELICEKGFGISLAQFFSIGNEVIVADKDMLEMLEGYQMLSDKQKDAVKTVILSYKNK